MRSSTIDLAKYLVRRPLAVFPLARAGWRLRRRGWWHHSPFIPLAPRDYWSFRVMTATGDGEISPRAEEMVQAARWAARQWIGR